MPDRIKSFTRKVKSLEELKRIIASEKSSGKIIVFANGCFDLIHGGHISYLESSRSQGDILIVGLNSDLSMRQIKGDKRPIMNELDRAEILAEMESVDYILIFDDPTCDKLLEELRPNIHAKGTDYTAETVPERETAKKLGIKTYIAGAPKENSTKDIIKAILEKYS